MAIPDYQTLMLPVLKIASDRQEHRLGDLLNQLALDFQLTESERQQLTPGGMQTTFSNRVGWAKTYLVQAGLLEATKRAHFRITERGLQAVASGLKRIDNDYLSQFDEFIEFRERNRPARLSVPSEEPEVSTSPVQAQTPDELLRGAVKQIETTLRKELLSRIIGSPPPFFEGLIVNLLLAMGYGGSRENAGKIVGQPGDGGIDGVIDQDALGLDRVYIQAKRYAKDNLVKEPEIRAFSGSLGAAKANKGVFVTTSSFTQPAIDFAERHPFRIILINGDQLASLMIHHNVGIRITQTVYLKSIDEDFFIEE